MLKKQEHTAAGNRNQKDTHKVMHKKINKKRADRGNIWERIV